MEMIAWNRDYQIWELDYDDIVNGRHNDLLNSLARKGVKYEILSEKLFSVGGSIKIYNKRDD